MSRLYDAADLDALISIDSIEGASFQGATGPPVVVDHLTLDLGVQRQSPFDASVIDVKDEITVLTSKLDESDLAENTSFTIASPANVAGTYRVLRVAEKDEQFITVAVRKD